MLRRGATAAVLVTAAAIIVLVVLAAVRGGGEGGGTRQELSEAAPPFTLPTVTGEEVASADHRGQHALLLYFNEGMGCGSCWDQIVDLEAEWGRFEPFAVRLVSIMVDPLDELAAEARSRGITTIVAADEDKRVSNAYDAMEASMHPGIKPGHSFVLVNKEGQMVWRWDWPGHGTPMYMDVDELYGEIAGRLEG